MEITIVEFCLETKRGQIFWTQKIRKYAETNFDLGDFKKPIININQ